MKKIRWWQLALARWVIADFANVIVDRKGGYVVEEKRSVWLNTQTGEERYRVMHTNAYKVRQ